MSVAKLSPSSVRIVTLSQHTSRKTRLTWQYGSPITYGSFWDNFHKSLDGLRDVWEHYKRKLNKLLGRPSTPDVGLLGGLIIDLRAATESHLNQRIDSVVVASPTFSGPTEEDIDDALD